MKKIILLLLCCLSSWSGFSQTLHAVIFADTFDATIGESVLQDYERMSIEMTTIAAALGYQLNKQFYRDYDYSLPNLKKTLDKLQCGKNDVVFFYASSHGARLSNDPTKFPRIGIGEGLISLSEIDQIIASKNPRFRIVIADCCNVIVKGIAAKELPEGVSKINSTQSINYKALFAQKGKVMFASSSPTEPSAAMADGGVFTTAWLKELGNVVAGTRGNVSWNTLFDRAKLDTKQRGGHTPIAEIAIETVPTPAPVAPTPQQSTPPVLQQPTPQKDIIIALIELANPAKDELSRIRMVQPTIQQFFSNGDAKVEVIGKNGVTLVDRKRAEDYVKFMATTKNLVQLVPIKVEKDPQGKVKALKVHEIYKN